MRIKSIFDGYSKSVSKVLMLPSGREFLTLSGVDDEIHQWRIVNSRIEPGWSVEGGSVVEERFLDLAVHPSGEYFACAARHRKVELRDSTNGQLIKEFGKASKSDQLSGYASCRFSINGSILVASQIRSTKTEFYSTTDGRRIGTIWDEVVTTFAAHPEGELIAALLNGGRRAAIQFLRITHSREMSQIGVRYLLRFLARDLRFSPAGDYLAVIGGIPPLIFQVYRFPTFERIVDYRINQEVDPENTNIPVCFKTSLEEGEVYDEYPLTNGVAFSRDGKRVFCPDFSGDIIEFAIPSGIEVAKRPGHSDVATSIDGDEKCDRFVSAGRDGSLIYWEGDAGTIASADSLDSPLTQSFLNLHHVESLKTKVIVKNILLPD